MRKNFAFERKIGRITDTSGPKTVSKYVITNTKGAKILYIRMQKALYGMLRSALLFYLKPVKDLKACGFELNPYYPCVANKMINGHQMTVIWHVDDLKLSQKSELEITKFIVYIGKLNGNKITVNQGDVHDYLGMDIDYSEKRKGIVKVSMIKYVEKIL